MKIIEGRLRQNALSRQMKFAPHFLHRSHFKSQSVMLRIDMKEGKRISGLIVHGKTPGSRQQHN
jgi:hypothetical protein